MLGDAPGSVDARGRGRPSQAARNGADRTANRKHGRIIPAPVHLYGHGSSGNVYKVQLLLSMLGRPYEHTPTDFDAGTRTPAFRAINPNGRVPAIVDGDFALWESDAILQYIAHGTPWWPQDRRLQAQVLQWMFFEQYSHEPYIAVSRSILHYRQPGPERDILLAQKRLGCEHALAVMEQHLVRRDWFVGDGPTIADIALYAYTHVAPEAGFDLAPYPAIRAWIARIETLPGHVAMLAYPAESRASIPA